MPHPNVLDVLHIGFSRKFPDQPLHLSLTVMEERRQLMESHCRKMLLHIQEQVDRILILPAQLKIRKNNMYTIVGVAKNSLMPRMTYDGQERGQLAIFSLIFGLGGTILLMSLTFPLMFRFGGGIPGWRIVFGIYGCVTTLALIFAFLLTHEHVGQEADAKKKEKSGIKFGEGLKLFFSNKYFLIAAAVTILVNFQTNINSSGQVYFYTYNMNDPLLTSSLSMVSLIPTVISIILLSGPSLRLFGKKKSIFVGAGVMIIGYLIRAAAASMTSSPGGAL